MCCSSCAASAAASRLRCFRPCSARPSCCRRNGGRVLLGKMLIQGPLDDWNRHALEHRGTENSEQTHRRIMSFELHKAIVPGSHTVQDAARFSAKRVLSAVWVRAPDGSYCQHNVLTGIRC
jgi:hypothetical protein